MTEFNSRQDGNICFRYRVHVPPSVLSSRFCAFFPWK